MNQRDKIHKIIAYGLIIAADAALAFVIVWVLGGIHPNLHFEMLSPKGVIASRQKHLMVTMVLLMLIVVLPVVVSAYVVAFKYRASNDKAEYKPEWTGNNFLKTLWWLIPSTIIFIICIMTWKYAHELDPFRAIDSNVKPVTVQVVSLNWKWLFLYPEQHIATVNFIEIPVNTPVNFELTSDGPMNSFWVPELGGQMYAMAGMSTELHLMANQTGEFDGSPAEINGEGFSGMRFKVDAVSQKDFDQWVRSVRQGSNVHNAENDLTADEYSKLAEPSTNNPPAFYPLADENLYNDIIQKYMGPPSVHGHDGY